jgi:hypothetical protein
MNSHGVGVDGVSTLDGAGISFLEALSKEALAERLVQLSEAKYTLQSEFNWLRNRHNNLILGLPPDKSPTSFHEKVNKYVSKEKEKEVKEKKKEDKEKEKDTTEARAQDPKLEEEIRGGREDEERRKKRKRE